MRRIDEQFLETPFYDVCQMTWRLRADGQPVSEKQVCGPIRVMGLRPINQRPKTSARAKEHKVWPYLLRGLKIKRATRKVLAWRLSNTLDTEPCVDALTEAVGRYCPPEIMNTDQGSQFTPLA